MEIINIVWFWSNIHVKIALLMVCWLGEGMVGPMGDGMLRVREGCENVKR